MNLRRTLLPVLLAGGLALGAARARAEEGEGPADDPRAKLKAQAEKILRLMRENEAALLEASTVGGAAPKGPEVPIPDTPPSASGTSPQGSPPPSGSGNGGGPSGGPRTGEEIRKRLEELIQAQQAGAGKIPDALGELVQMIPKGQGGGGGGEHGQPPPSGSGSEGDMSPEAREQQKKKELQEQQEREQGKDGKDPKGAEKRERDASGRPPSETDVPPSDPSNPDATPWDARLPAEMRTSEAGGGLERLPGRLGQIIQDYLKNLHRQTTPGGAPR